MNKIFLKLNTINNSVSSKALFKIISDIVIQETTLDLEKELWKSEELSMRRICLMEYLREWVIIPDEHKMDWCTKRVYKLLKKKLPMQMVIMVAKLIWALSNNQFLSKCFLITQPLQRKSRFWKQLIKTIAKEETKEVIASKK